jgi:hypothetical protein
MESIQWSLCSIENSKLRLDQLNYQNTVRLKNHKKKINMYV